MLEKAATLEAEAKYADAALLYQKAIQKDAKYGEAYRRFGALLIKQDKDKDAYTSLTMAHELMPNSDQAKIDLGRQALSMLLKSPQRVDAFYKSAEKMAGQLLSKNPQSFEGLRIKAYLAMTGDEPTETIVQFRKVLAVKPNDAELTTVLVQNLLIAKQEAEAEKLARESIPAMKTFGPLYDSLYSIYEKSGRLQEGEAILKLKIANNPKDSFAVIQLADHYQAAKQDLAVEAILKDYLANEAAYPHAKLEAGDFYRRTGKLDQAAALFQRGADAGNGRRLEYLQRLAGVRIEQKRIEEASAVLETLLKESPGDTDALYSRAALRMASGKQEEMRQALDQFTKLVEQAPDKLDYRLSQAKAYRDLGQGEKAAIAYEEILKRQPKNRVVLREMADLSIRAQKPMEALGYAERLIELSPRDPGTRLVRTSAWALQRRWPEVKTELRRLTTEYPELTEAWLQLATVNIDGRNFVEAERILLRLQQKNPKDIRILRRLAALYQAQGQGRKALAMVQKELGGKPERDARTLVAGAAAQAGETDLALELVRKMTLDFPGDAEHWSALGELQQRAGKQTEAIYSFEQATKLAPNQADAHARLGSAYGQAGNYSAAVKAYRQSVKLAPGAPLWTNNLAWFLAQSGANLDEAASLAQKAMQQEPENLEFSDTLAMIYLKGKRYEHATQTLQSIVRRQPNNAEFRMHLATAWLEQGKKDKAKTELEAGLRAQASPQQTQELRKMLAQLN